MCLATIINRQYDIALGNQIDISLPKYRKYAVCNLRGGIGKTTLSFNLSFLADNLLAIDTCPQGNLSYFYDNQYYASNNTNIRDIIIPYIVPGLGKATHVASFIGATNNYFSNKNNYYIPSTEELYLLPSQLIMAINQANGLPVDLKTQSIHNILYSLDYESTREMEENGLDKCIIDTSPFFAGATQLSWYAS